MPLFNVARFATAALAVVGLSLTSYAQPPSEVFDVWPAEPPTVVSVPGEEQILEGRPRPFYQITNVSTPTVSVFAPPKSERTGAAILVCPGGGLQRLAIEHEGIEVARWLTSQGITAFVLKYRVPAPVEIGVQDAQRAISLVRSRASQWNIDPDNIGTMGFSAGGEIGAWLSTHFDRRLYDAIDEHDSASCRPTYAVLVYPGGLVSWRSGQVKEAVFSRIGRETPPMFFAHAFDDSCQNSLQLALALKKAGVPAELHIYQQGGHGFGARSSGHPVGHWKDAFVRWAKSNGFLDPSWIREVEQDLRTAIQTGGDLPNLGQRHPEATLEDAYVIQKRLVAASLREDRLAGFKGAASNAAAQESLGISSPLTGVLLSSGKIDAGENLKVPIRGSQPSMIETEIGFVVAVDIGYEVLTVQQARDAVAQVVPVIELPRSYADQAAQDMSAKEIVASNVGSDRFIVGKPKKPASIDVMSLPIQMSQDGESIHQANSGLVKGDHWTNLHSLMNQIVAQGYTIPSGSVILSGALGAVHAAEPGDYTATFGELGSIDFRLVEATDGEPSQ